MKTFQTFLIEKYGVDSRGAFAGYLDTPKKGTAKHHKLKFQYHNRKYWDHDQAASSARSGSSETKHSNAAQKHFDAADKHATEYHKITGKKLKAKNVIGYRHVDVP